MSNKVPNESPVKLTKKEIDGAISAGFTHAKMTNKSVNKRQHKIVREHDRKQAVAAAKKRQEDKKFDQFLAKQQRNVVDEKFLDFEKEVNAITVSSSHLPGETFPAKTPESQEFDQNL